MLHMLPDTAVLFAGGIPIPFEAQTTRLAASLGLPATDVQNAFWTMAVGALCAVCCSLAGCFLVLRRISLLGDALSHSVLAGTAGVYLLTGRVDPVPMLCGAIAAGIVTAVLTQFVHKAALVPEDSSIGIVFTSLFAFGVVVVSQAKHVHLDLDCVLFGDLAFAGVNLHPTFGWLVPESFRSLIPTLMITLLLLAVFWKELRLTSFDPTLAVTLGFSATLMHYLLTTVVAIVTVSAMDVVGLLVVALLIVPAAIARLLTDRLSTMLVLSCLIGVSCTTIGYLLALRWDSSAAGLSAVVAGAELLVAIVVSPKNGLLGRLLRTVRLRIRICAEDVLAGLFRRQERSDAPDKRVQASVSECHTLAGGGIMSVAALRWLLSRQLLQQAGPVMLLSETGLRYARSMVRSHRLWEAYLQENFNLPSDHLHDPAEAMEHFIGPGVQQQITEELSQSAEDPHGRAIPDVKRQDVR
ncbi:MAG: iron chelate uptake ABC transporter family permease subunit [Fuerstiella sp.]|nr:iron chelate uptake ABC transporter family permease subunit [Fuerstiella sp.]